MKNNAIPRIKAMKPYSPPLDGRRKFDGILLDFNERTIEPSKKVKEAIQDFLSGNKLQIYPEYGTLEKKLAEYIGVDADLVITSGADQAIDLVFRTFTDSGDNVIIPAPSFAMFFQSAQTVGNTIIAPYYDKTDLSFPLEKVLQSISPAIKLIVICNPNNPTGTLVSLDDIEKIAEKAKDSIILIDEVYGEFSGISAVSLIERYPNIIIAKSFSKSFGLASLRIGYIVTSQEHKKEILKVRGPYDINMLAYVAALAALDDVEDMKQYINEVMTQAKPMIENFFSENNIVFYKSSANFILFKPDNSELVEKTLRENGILIRPQNKPGIEGTLRVSIGTVEQMKKFIDIYERFILNVIREQKKYAFIDRDGTLIFEPQDTYQIDSLEKLKILDGVIEGLKKLQTKGYQLIMISNQDGLGTDSFPKDSFDAPQNKMLELFKKEGIVFEKIFVCPHFAFENCDCRKPKLGLIKDFLNESKIDMDSSFVVGDRDSDREYANNIGIKFVPMKTNDNFYKALKGEGVIS